MNTARLGAAGLILATGTMPQTPPGIAGSEACRTCHQEQYDAWARSTHGTAGGPPGPATVIAPFDGSAIRFADAVVSPVVRDDGRYVFVVERSGRPPMELEVTGVVGRGHMVGGGTQGFASLFPDGTERFLPFDYSEDGDTWFCNTAFVGGFWVPGADRARLRADAGWLPITEAMRLTECGDWPPVRILGTSRRFANCQNCHGSQIEVRYRADLARYETQAMSLAINCESCHGPALAHVEEARAAGEPGVLPASLATLDVDASLRVCFECHALKRAIGVDSGDGPRDGPQQYSLGLPLIGDSPYLPDGRIATFGYQQTHRSSACYLFGSMTCVDCHDPHGQGYRDVFGNALEGRFDDRQCTACHASKAADPEAHTFHPAGSDGAACTSCHMPYVQHPELSPAIPYARADHTISIPRPGFDEEAGLQSACSGCHSDRSPAELAAQVAAWWGEVAPHRAEVAALVTATAPAASPGDLDRAVAAAAARGPRHGMAKLMAVDAWVRGRAAQGLDEAGDRSTGGLDDVPGRALATLVRDDDEDVRAAAAAALHATRGDDPDVRALLDAVTRGAPDQAAFRARWAAALTQWAAAVDRVGGPAAALPYLRRAQEVRPTAPDVLVALGAGLAAAGDMAQAVQVYLEALRHGPGDPVALVNVGLALETLGREEDAAAMYEEAVRVRPTEALAHLNLGNTRFRRGDFEGAIAAYRAAVRNDAGLSRAHFYLGVSLANTGRVAEALPSLYNALEFAPDDAEIQDVIRQVEAVLRY
ncbi:MAG: ammonia-forming cytochrome c nitrite reductase subunit c552 [Gemmatimonadetes bacterium]|nr:ammonia-forming cytochrome c nitrite reductase subunit c552 [Gemmatimonadota bacterium]